MYGEKENRDWMLCNEGMIMEMRDSGLVRLGMKFGLALIVVWG